MKLDPKLVRELVDGVPHFDRFKLVDELEEASRELAKKYPAKVEHRTIGQSSEGRPITALLVGEGDHSVFMYGFTHPNEPIGSLTVEYLASRLAASAELRKKFGCRFIMAKAIDVDGARLNEGWFRGPFDLLTYAENYYRPPPNEQAEWTFPIHYKTLHWDTPIPETQAIKKVVDEFRPEFTYILHNADFCGVYYYLSEALPAAYGDLQNIPLSEGLPLHRGEPPDEPYLKTLDDGIYHDYGVSDEFEFLSKTLGGDPAKKINYGTDCYEYIRNIYNGFCLTCELPYFYDQRIENTSPTAHKRRDLLIESLGIEGQAHELIKHALEKSHDLLDKSSRIYRAIRCTLDSWSDAAETTHVFSKDQEFDRPASVAESFDLTVLKSFSVMPALGMMQRLLKEAEERTQHRKLVGLRNEIRSHLLQLDDAIRKECVPQTIPIPKLVRIQLESALVCLRHLDFDSLQKISRQ
jgi:hypothetical protein